VGEGASTCPGWMNDDAENQPKRCAIFNLMDSCQAEEARTRDIAPSCSVALDKNSLKRPGWNTGVVHHKAEHFLKLDADTDQLAAEAEV
jgi:hypothetical protein